VRFLVIDDNPFVRRLYQMRARQRADVHIDCAESYEAGLALIASSKAPYHLVVCDEHLGRLAHADVSAFLRSLSSLELPVALITDGVATFQQVGPNVRVWMRPVGLEELVAHAASGPR
jgi:DNA-binding response OmpR family regulator